MIEIKNAWGERLVGNLHKAESKTLIICCHGRMCDKESFFMPLLAAQLSGAGSNAFRFDFSGNGESEGSFGDSTLTKQIDDLHAVMDHFAGNYEIILLGHSMGAVVCMLYQARHGKAKAVIDIAGTLDQREHLKFTTAQLKELDKSGTFQEDYFGKPFKITKKYYEDRYSYGDIRKDIKKIDVPVLIIQGTEDVDTPPINGDIAAKAIKNSDLATLNGADHYFENYEAALAAFIVKWLENL